MIILIRSTWFLWIELRVFITQKSTSQNIVQNTPRIWANVSMVTTALSHIVPKSSKPDWSIKWKKTLIFICFTSRLSGVHSIKSITKRNVFMLITGKTSGESPIFSIINATKLVIIGSQVHSSPNTTKDAQTKHLVNIHTAGRNKSTILCFTKLSLVKRRYQIQSRKGHSRNAPGVLNALIIIRRKTKESQRWSSSKEIDLTFCMIKFLKCRWTYLTWTSSRS